MDEEEQETTLGLTEAVRKKISASQPKSADNASRDAGAAAAHPLSDELAGTVVAGRYELSDKIFEDETYLTFRGEHALTKRRVNVKLLRAHLCLDQDAQLAFQLLVQEHLAGRLRDRAGLCADYGIADNGRQYAVYLPEIGGESDHRQGAEETSDLAETIRREIEEAKKNQHK